jgi:TPR repeat protein
MIRMANYRYRFTDLATYRSTGHFWKREYLGDYLPMLYLNARQKIIHADSELEETQAKADFGNPEAQNRLGQHWINGEQGLARNPLEAAAWFRRAAEQGLAEAQFNLTLFLLNGEGAPPDLPQAAAWCRRAAEQGLTNAQDLLGLMYARGDGVVKDPVEALAWFQVAAHYGHKEASGRAASLKSQLRPEIVQSAERRFETIRSGIEARKKATT